MGGGTGGGLPAYGRRGGKFIEEDGGMRRLIQSGSSALDAQTTALVQLAAAMVISDAGELEKWFVVTHRAGVSREWIDVLLRQCLAVAGYEKCGCGGQRTKSCGRRATAAPLRTRRCQKRRRSRSSTPTPRYWRRWKTLRGSGGGHGSSWNGASWKTWGSIASAWPCAKLRRLASPRTHEASRRVSMKSERLVARAPRSKHCSTFYAP